MSSLNVLDNSLQLHYLCTIVKAEHRQTYIGQQTILSILATSNLPLPSSTFSSPLFPFGSAPLNHTTSLFLLVLCMSFLSVKTRKCSIEPLTVTVDVFQQKLTRLANLYMAENLLEAIPFIPESVRILHFQVSLYESRP